jgi:hypothetical protein
MIARVGDVERVAFEREALRPPEGGGVERAVLRALRARADGLDERAVEPRDDDAVVVGIGNEEAAAALVGQDLAGEGERQVADLRAFEREPERFFVKRAARAKVGGELADGRVERVVVSLALDLPDDVAAGSMSICVGQARTP